MKSITDDNRYQSIPIDINYRLILIIVDQSITKIRVVINWYRFPMTINRLIDIDWLQISSRFKIYKLTEHCINITSLYALIVNTFYFNALNINMRPILSSSSYYNAPSTCIRFPLKTQKFLSVLLSVHTFPMKTVIKNGLTFENAIPSSC